MMAVVLGAPALVNAAPSDIERGACFREARFGMFIRGVKNPHVPTAEQYNALVKWRNRRWSRRSDALLKRL